MFRDLAILPGFLLYYICVNFFKLFCKKIWQIEILLLNLCIIKKIRDMEKINISDFITWMEANATNLMHTNAIKSFKIIRRNKGEIKIEWKHFAKVNGFVI